MTHNALTTNIYNTHGVCTSMIAAMLPGGGAANKPTCRHTTPPKYAHANRQGTMLHQCFRGNSGGMLGLLGAELLSTQPQAWNTVSRSVSCMSVRQAGSSSSTSTHLYRLLL